jgi:menaquinol-cytochrome c reductase iron-sulfur subunit
MPKKYRSPVMDRRNFVKLVTASLGSMMAAIIGLPVIQYFISPALGRTEGDDWISLGSLENYPIGTPTLFNFTLTKVNGWERSSQSYGAFVLRQEGPNEPIVFSDVCTHLSCRVNWDEDSQEFYCPCHAAYFDGNGEVVSGPPPRALDRYEIRLDEDQLFIHLTEG